MTTRYSQENPLPGYEYSRRIEGRESKRWLGESVSHWRERVGLAVRPRVSGLSDGQKLAVALGAMAVLVVVVGVWVGWII